MPAAPSVFAALAAAVTRRHPVAVSYHDKRRVICPHALGWRNGRALVLGYQTGGQTSRGTLDADPRKRWRLLFVDEIEDLCGTGTATAWGSADNYDPAHPFPVIDEVVVAVS